MKYGDSYLAVTLKSGGFCWPIIWTARTGTKNLAVNDLCALIQYNRKGLF